MVVYNVNSGGRVKLKLISRVYVHLFFFFAHANARKLFAFAHR